MTFEPSAGTNLKIMNYTVDIMLTITKDNDHVLCDM